MAIDLPEWIKPNFVNVENLCIDLFSGLFPSIESGCWAPDDWLEQQINVDPLLMFFRLPGGKVDWQARKDQCNVQVLAVTGTRDDSWVLMDAVRAILLPMSGDKVRMADGYVAQIWGAREVAGPQLLTPGQQIDTRVVSASFELTVGMKTASHYKEHVHAL